MNLRNFYYRQRVTEGELDQIFAWAQDADRAIMVDKDEAGVSDGLALSETGPASMSVAYANGVAYAKAGERCAVDVASNVDCSQDEYGVPTAVAVPGNTKWIAIFVRPTRVLSEPRTDGNGNEVYTIQAEAAEVFVRQGSEGVGPARVSLSTSAILLGEVELAFGQTAITTADIYVDRREDWFRAVTVSFGDKVHGTSHDAVAELWAELDVLGAAGGTFAFTSKWFSAVDVAGTAPPITTVAEALDGMVYDMAQSTGSGLVGTANVAGTYLNWTGASVAGALSATATAVNQHIGGAAPQHPATSITYTPYSWIAGATVGAALNEIIDDLALQTGTSGAARIGNLAFAETVYHWFAKARGYDIDAGTLEAQIAAIFAAVNRSLPTDQIAMTPSATVDGTDAASYSVLRGVVAPGGTMSWRQLAAQDYGDIGSSVGIQSAIPWAPPNYKDFAGREFVDVCPGIDFSAGNGGRPCFWAIAKDVIGFYRLNHISAQSAGIGDQDRTVPTEWSVTYPTYMPIACASNGKYLYVLTANASHVARMFQFDVYTNPSATPTLYKTSEYSGIEIFDAAATRYFTALCPGTNTLAFTANNSTGTLTADEFVVIVAQNDVTSWAKGRGNVGIGASYDSPLGALTHIGDDTYMFTVYDIATSKSFGCAAKATVVAGLVTAVVAPASPASVYDFGTVYVKSAVFDGASAWFADTDGQIYCYNHIGSGAIESQRWNTFCELNTNQLVDNTSDAPIRLAFDGMRVWIFARQFGYDRIVAMSFDPADLINPTSLNFAAFFNQTFLNAPRTAGWASNGPSAGEGPGRVAIIADVAMVIGRFYTPAGIMHRLCSLSRRGGHQFV